MGTLETDEFISTEDELRQRSLPKRNIRGRYGS